MSIGRCLETTSGEAMGLFVRPAAFDLLGILGSVDEPGEGTSCGFFEYIVGGVCGVVPEPGMGACGFFEYAGGVLETPVGV